MTRFRRLVLELGHGAADPGTLREAAAFARLLDAELHALFVEDATLLNASALPFTREISPVSCRWRPLETGRLEAEFRAAADRARQQLTAAADAIGVRQTFEVRRGDLALHVTDVCVSTDIVVVSPPRRMDTASGGRRLSETARRSAASVLFLPPQASRRHGVIVAVATGPDDPGLAVARRIAAQYHEGLLVLAPIGGVIPVEPDVRYLPGTSAADVVATLGNLRERLIVLTRAADSGLAGEAAETGSALAAARGVPVLLVEPA